jgi:hypothetical protein
VQIIGGFLEDRTTIKFAELVEREFGGFTPPPLTGSPFHTRRMTSRSFLKVRNR